jgi:hypothetical protein
MTSKAIPKNYDYIKKCETLVALYNQDYEHVDMSYLKELAEEGFAKLDRDTFSITLLGAKAARPIMICFDFIDIVMELYGKEVEQLFDGEGVLWTSPTDVEQSSM